MKVLLLHPEDSLPELSAGSFDLVVDLARAPASTYANWQDKISCRVISEFDFFHGFEDLYRIRDLVRLGAGGLVDRHGIDWWDVISPLLVPELEQAIMMLRLAESLGDQPQLVASRPDARATALQRFLNTPCTCLKQSAAADTCRHYRDVLSRFNRRQLFQIAQDKFDPEHALRRRLTRRKPADRRPVYLLPSAYVNVSRMAIAYASLLPDEYFLLVTTRRDGRLNDLPSNVRMISLDSYFRERDDKELASLVTKLGSLRDDLSSSVPEFRMANELGMFDRIPRLLRWGVAAGAAWRRLFDSENIVGCLSADDANPYTSLPLHMAQQRGIPALAVHHGALDYRMAVKTLYADRYIAKGELERDFLVRQCHVPAQKIAMGSPRVPATTRSVSHEAKPWMVFFTEPYGSAGWRMEEVYRDLLPRLRAMSRERGLTLVFKLHPFESAKGHKNLLRKFLSPSELKDIVVVSGPATEELWSKIRFAMTVESTIALECTARGVPVFLCSWLQSVHAGYVAQYARFGIGQLLQSAKQIGEIGDRLAQAPTSAGISQIWQQMDPDDFRALLHGAVEQQIRTIA